MIVGCETRKAIQPTADLAPVVDALIAIVQRGARPAEVLAGGAPLR